MATFENLAAVRDAVVAADDLLTLEMIELRDAVKYDRLGKHVRDQISRELQGLGIAHYPPELPDRQWSVVRLYKMGSAAADLIDAVLNPAEEHDRELRDLLAGEDRERLRQIRAVLGA